MSAGPATLTIRPEHISIGDAVGAVTRLRGVDDVRDESKGRLTRALVLQKLACQAVSLPNIPVCNVPSLQFDFYRFLVLLADIP
jgi:hypothetical protein